MLSVRMDCARAWHHALLSTAETKGTNRMAQWAVAFISDDAEVPGSNKLVLQKCRGCWRLIYSNVK